MVTTDSTKERGSLSVAKSAQQERISMHARTEANSNQRTVLYLAYGSNLAAKNFLERRGMRPLSQINVLVPELRLTFDQPGFPYIEPCFATTEFRDPECDDPVDPQDPQPRSGRFEEIGRLLVTATYKNPWRKPLVGVAYEVTPSDYSKVVKTEGGGMAYQDVVVDCYPFPDDFTPNRPVPLHPEEYSKPFRAHSLLSFSTALKVKTYEEQHNGEKPELLPGSEASHKLWAKYLRPHKGYSQPSERYKKLLVTGAAEHSLPLEWQDYLKSTETYHITTARQKIGRAIVLLLFVPFEVLIFVLMVALAQENGRSPKWLGVCRRFQAGTMWKIYDIVLKPLFGDGERAIRKSNGSVLYKEKEMSCLQS
ncbi:hypothetical protein KEM54_001477 [Ascosphaera aggregata]|nr:hypothetical protein KEM54_001477 [Ascosphaera aggregata]